MTDGGYPWLTEPHPSTRRTQKRQWHELEDSEMADLGDVLVHVLVEELRRTVTEHQREAHRRAAVERRQR